MTQTDQSPESFLPLSNVVFHILLALADDARHGYGIMSEVEQRTEGKVHLAPGTLYGAIKRLLKQGLIEELGERPDPELDDERRRYYRLTEFGQKVLQAEVERLGSMLRQAMAKQMLPGNSTRFVTGSG